MRFEKYEKDSDHSKYIWELKNQQKWYNIKCRKLSGYDPLNNQGLNQQLLLHDSRVKFKVSQTNIFQETKKSGIVIIFRAQIYLLRLKMFIC